MEAEARTLATKIVGSEALVKASPRLALGRAGLGS